ncbi:MAG: hypothetical protein ACP5PQ_05625 [Thermoproteota archaeon]
MGKKVAGILLTVLILSLELNSTLLLRRVSAQPEEFAKKLEEHLGKAIPEDLLAEECEYVVPEGFNLTLAERLWRDLSLYVSAGCTTEELRSEVKKTYGNSSLIKATLSSGKTIGLNVSGVSVERSLEDGSVSIKIPVASSMSLSYARYNFTKTAGFYEAWNKTLVRKYRVWRREPGWYEYTMKFLETNRSVKMVSRVSGADIRVGFEGVETVLWSRETGGLPVFSYVMGIRFTTFVIAVPGHYEDVRVVVPRQETSYRVLFPAYDPVAIDNGEGWGWVVDTEISSTSLNVGEVLEISYSASYEPPQPMVLLQSEEPLNATLTLNAPDSFYPLNSLVRRLNDTHTTGVFRLRAIRPGLYNLTLSLEGNAAFSPPLGHEETYTVQVVSPEAPSLNIEVMDVDESVLKHARLRIRLSNNGGGAARNVSAEITGSCIQGVSRTLEDISAR